VVARVHPLVTLPLRKESIMSWCGGILEKRDLPERPREYPKEDSKENKGKK
jgi:hypothetical protein